MFQAQPKRILVALGCYLALIYFDASVGRSDVIYRRGTSIPLIGQVIDSDETQLVLKYAVPQQGVSQITLPREEILSHVRTVERSRLEALTSGEWEAYRDYAEELSAYRLDPLAHATSLRLYLIVAYQAEGSSKMGALQALVRLARSPEEERRFRLLAYRTDPLHDPDWLQTPREIGPVELFDAEAQAALLECFRLARQGYAEQAIDLARRPEVKPGFQSISHLMTFREFQTAAYDKSHSESRLKRLLQIELALMGEGVDQIESDGSQGLSQGWSQLVSQNVSTPFSELTWLNVTEFDPQKTVFKNGNWE